MGSIFLGLFLVLLGGIFAFILPQRYRATVFILFIAISVFLLLIPVVHVLYVGQDIVYTREFPYPLGRVTLLLDPLAAFFVLIINVAALLGALWAKGHLTLYTNLRQGVHFFTLALLIFSMNLVCMAQQYTVFLMLWELMSVSSFFLIIFDHTRKEVLNAGIYYLISMHIGFFMLLFAFLGLAILSGGTDFSSFISYMNHNPSLGPIALLGVLAGFAIKAGFFPFHFWLPKAHPAAPTHISALMSAVMIKTGFYGILRFLLPFTLSWFPALLLLCLSVFSVVYGIVYAMMQSDMKKMLAYSSIENIGIAGIGCSVGLLGLLTHYHDVATWALLGGLMHVLNHAVFKQMMFHVVGVIYQKTHTRDMAQLGGLAKSEPVLSVLAMPAVMAIAGLPPLAGFMGELFIVIGLFKGILVLPVLGAIGLLIVLLILITASAIALLVYSKFYGLVFSGIPRVSLAQSSLPDRLFLLIPITLGGIYVILSGVYPLKTVNVVIQPMLSRLGLDLAVADRLLITQVSYYLFAVTVLTGALLIVRKRFAPKAVSQPTWGCGYDAVNTRMQYSPASYSAPFMTLVAPFLNLRIMMNPITALFPRDASLRHVVRYMLEKHFLVPAARLTKHALARFSWIQSGYMQNYIFYGVFFLICAVVYVLWVGRVG